MELADSCALKQTRCTASSSQDNNVGAMHTDNNDTIDDLLQQNENQQQIFVAFTGLLPEQRDKLADLVASLGGQLTEDMMQCTHLVAKNIIRTPKFYYGILRGCHIVTMKWVQACAYRQQFIDETAWKLEDKEGERQFGFNLEYSLNRARSRLQNHIAPLFQSLEFFLSPRAKHRQICIELIRASGGTIREKRPIQKMALMPEPRHLIICHEDDSHLANYLTRTKTGNKAVHHEEFILSCVMRQELDFDSYQIQYVSVIKNAFNNPPAIINNVHESAATIGKDSPLRSVVYDNAVDSVDHNSNPTEINQTAKVESTTKYPNIFSQIGYSSLDLALQTDVAPDIRQKLNLMMVKTEETDHDNELCLLPIPVSVASSEQNNAHVKVENLTPSKQISSVHSSLAFDQEKHVK